MTANSQKIIFNIISYAEIILVYQSEMILQSFGEKVKRIKELCRGIRNYLFNITINLAVDFAARYHIVAKQNIFIYQYSFKQAILALINTYLDILTTK